MKSTAFFLCFLLAFLAACSQNTRPPQAETPASKQTSQPVMQVDPATAAGVSGVISFSGPAPKLPLIDTAGDPACAATRNGPLLAETAVVNNGKLANVFVYVKQGLEGQRFAIPDRPVVIDQQGCRYLPHVAGAMTGQTVRFLNSDLTMHNVHPSPEHNDPWNESQTPKGKPIDKQFAQPELMIPVRCNQHPWMRMYLNVVETPFFTVSDGAGTFEISGLPPGSYTIAAVHEKLGEQTQQITVSARETKTADFTFPASGGSAR